MATKYTSLDSKTETKKTVFTHFLDTDRTAQTTDISPNDFGNVLHIGHDSDYGDVFKCWSNNHTNFTIFFLRKRR